MTTAAVRRYWSRVVDLGCVAIVDGFRCRAPAEIAHAHGGSVVHRMQEPKAKGKKLPRYDWLVIPLCPNHHRNGPDALDYGVDRWEVKFGSQANHLDHVAACLSVDVWELARRCN